MTARSAIALVVSCLLPAAAAAESQTRSAAPLLAAFFEALNSGDPGAMAEFSREGMTEGFRSRRSEEEDRALYQRLRDDLGRLTVREMRRVSPSRAVVTLGAEKTPMGVEFVFDLAGGRIDGFSVQVGGPPGQREAMIELPPGASDETISTALDRQLRDLAAADRFSGVVLLARDGEPFFHRGYGLADRDKRRAVDVTTRFDVGSITKLVTRIAIAQLARAGELDLEDRLAEHLPDYPNREIAGRITIAQLVEHRSGLGDIFGPRWIEADKASFIEPADFFPLFADQPLQFEPGKGRSYSNAGYVTLGAVVSAVSGKPYFEYMEQKIFRPAGMTRSGFPAKDGSDPGLAIGYTRGGPGDEPGKGDGRLTPNLGMLPIRGCPAGSSSHAAEDLLALERALRGGKLLDAEWTSWIFGAGFAGEAASAVIGIAGGGPGVSAGWESDGSTTAIVLSNLDPPSGERLAIDLYRALAGR